MKNTNKIILGVCLLASAVSCSTKLLDIEQKGVLTTNEYVTADDKEALQFIAAVYAEYQGDAFNSIISGGPACHDLFKTLMSRMGGDDADGFLYNESADGSTYSSLWRYWYRTIYWCNMIIEKMPANGTASAAVRDQVIAEARVMRAICMSYLVQLFGNPPLADHLMDGTEICTPAAESWEFIESELNEAAEDLPTKAGPGGQAAIGGRLTREAAYAFLGRAQLWQKKWQAAASTLYEKVIATGKYSLNDNYADYSSSVSDFCDENIWEFEFNDKGENSNSQEGCFNLIAFSPQVGSWNDTYASLTMEPWGNNSNLSQDLVDAYKAHDGEGSVRWNATVMDVCTASAHGAVNSPVKNSDGYFNMREVCRVEDVVGTFPYQYSIRNKPYMRYAEVLLNYAEAVAQGGAAGSLSGLEALNMVRRRAGLADAPSLSMEDPSYGIKAERRIELYGEGLRFIDVVRWGDGSELAGVGRQMHTCNLSGGSASGAYSTFNIILSETGGPGFVVGKDELFPIPASEINQNPALAAGQNPGW